MILLSIRTKFPLQVFIKFYFTYFQNHLLNQKKKQLHLSRRRNNKQNLQKRLFLILKKKERKKKKKKKMKKEMSPLMSTLALEMMSLMSVKKISAKSIPSLIMKPKKFQPRYSSDGIYPTLSTRCSNIGRKFWRMKTLQLQCPKKLKRN